MSKHKMLEILRLKIRASIMPVKFLKESEFSKSYANALVSLHKILFFENICLKNFSIFKTEICMHYLNKKTINSDFKFFPKIKCLICKTIATILLNQLNRPEIRQILLNIINQFLCFNSKIPQLKNYICENTVKSYIPLIFTKFLQILDNQQLCYVRVIF